MGSVSEGQKRQDVGKGEAAPVPAREALPSAPPDLNIRILRPLAGWVRDTHGPGTLQKLAGRCGIPLDLLEDRRSHWTSLERFEAFLLGVRELAGSEEGFRAACVHRFQEAYGPFRILLWALSPEQIYRQVVKTMPLLCRHARFELAEERPGSARIRYVTDRREGRLACLSRMEHLAHGPTWVGMPPARVTEHGCIARGDEACEYELRFVTRVPALRTAAGVGAGVAAAVLLHVTGVLSVSGALLLPVVGGLAVYVLEAVKANRVNLRTAEEIRAAVTQLARDDAEARRELNRTLDALAKRKALAAVGEFASNLAHELRNPLTAIRVDLQRIEEVSDDGARRRVLTDRMLAAVRRLDRTVSGVLRVVGSGRIDPAPIRLGDPLVAAMSGALPLLESRGAELRTPGPAEASTRIHGDPDALERLFLNLLLNAAESLEEDSGGWVEVTVHQRSDPDTPSPPDAAPWVEVRIRDNGQGMSRATLERVFEPLFSTKPEGTGLGMAIARRIARTHGGDIHVESEPEVGTTVAVRLPLEPPSGEGGEG